MSTEMNGRTGLARGGKGSRERNEEKTMRRTRKQKKTLTPLESPQKAKEKQGIQS